MTSGFQYVKEKLLEIPKDPGCYLMKDAQGKIFYIGKAKNLKNRLKSYLTGADTRLFVQFLEEILADIEIIVVKKDLEALLLERELIKKHNPRFNIMLKDDKNYILLKIKKNKNAKRKKDLYPRLEIVRKVKKDGAKYFGPYPSAQRLRMTFELINKYFLLRTCNDKEIENRHRPCIQYQINRCPAPCVFNIPEYQKEIDNVILFLSGDFKALKQRLEKKMLDFSLQEEFEKAAKIRDQINAIEVSLTKQVLMDVSGQKNQDIIGWARLGPEIEIIKISIRNGIWHESENFPITEQPFPSEEVLQRFLENTYDENSEIPDEIILPLDISQELLALNEYLNLKRSKKIHVFLPKKGKSLELLEIANKNAQNALNERLKQKEASLQAVSELKELLNLSMPPKRIECIDISIMQGKEPMGSSVVFIDGKPQKNLYRHYNIKTVEGMDDFSMIHEVVLRRLKKAITENTMPNLLLIDGGKGQLNAALKAIDEVNIIPSHNKFYVCGIAKARQSQNTDERIFIPNKDEPILLEPHTYGRYLVERIRDEAHRFAITAHKKARSKRTLTSKLLEIPGISKKRAIILLKYFGSFKNIENSSIEDLVKAPGIGPKQAQIIYDWFLKNKNI